MNEAQVLAEVGRLHMENLELRARLEAAVEMIRDLSGKQPAVEPAAADPGAPQGDLPAPAE